jgi:hypothetical protein
MPRNEQPVYRYGDFPELFWDLKPDLEVDRENPRVIARVLQHGSMDAIRKLVPMPVLLRDFEKLELPEHSRRFWSLVVQMRREKLARGARGHVA